MISFKRLSKFLLALFAAILATVLILTGSATAWYYSKLKAYPVALVISQNNGCQLGNQLWQWVHLYAYCQEKDYALFNSAFSPHYGRYFEHLKNNATFTAQGELHNHPLFCKLWQTVQKKFVRHLFCNLPLGNCVRIRAMDYSDIPLPPYKEEQLPFHPYLEDCQFTVDKRSMGFSDVGYFQSLAKGNYFIQGWSYVTPYGLEKHHAKIVEYFRPNFEIAAKIDQFWNEHNLSNQFVIGVHVRQGDYRTFYDGAHFFETPVYCEKMKLLQQMYAHLNPVFIVFSNEPRSLVEFEGIENCLVHSGNLVEDLYAMARCQIVLGPVSTYSDWAAFYGKGKRFYMEDPILVERENMTKMGLYNMVRGADK